jgi:hypothetical protein
MKWLFNLFARKPVVTVLPVPISEPETVCESPFQSLAYALTEGPSSRIRDLEAGLLDLRERFNNRQLLLFKTLCVLYANDEKLRAEKFQDFVDRVEGDFVNLEAHELDEAKRHMIARGIGHESDVL